MGMLGRCGVVIMQSEPASSQCTDRGVVVDGCKREMSMQWAGVEDVKWRGAKQKQSRSERPLLLQ